MWSASFMRTDLLSALVMGMALASCGDGAEAQAPSPSADSRLRIEWTIDPPRGQSQWVCGYIYNDTPVTPREVSLLVEGRDASDRVITSRTVSVFGYITPHGRTYFCSTATAGAARYSVTILGAQWASDR
jgi:hypothetical protein